jgi:hypothetical protein
MSSIAGNKATRVLIDGQPIIHHIVARLAASGGFAPIHVAGPATKFASLDLNAELIDVDGTVDQNIKQAVERVRERFPQSPIAFVACDVLPDIDTLKRVLERYWASAPCDAFFPLSRVPESREQLGQSKWKPTYRLLDNPGENPTEFLPGHLVIADPEALRLEFLYRIIGLSYKTRNRSIGYRRNVLVRNVIFELLRQDLRHILALRPPTLTITVISTGIDVAMRLMSGTINRRALEDAARRIVVTTRHRKRFPERRICLPMLDELSLARDLDTVEEAGELG